MAATAKKRMGRPPLPPDKKRGQTVGFKPTPEVRQKLQEAAAANDRSVSKEIETRLERTFGDDERFGGIATYRLMQIFGLAKQLIEDQTGKRFETDPGTYDEVTEAWVAILEKFRPKGAQKRSYGLLSPRLGRELGESVAEHFANIEPAKTIGRQSEKPRRKAENKR